MFTRSSFWIIAGIAAASVAPGRSHAQGRHPQQPPQQQPEPPPGQPAPAPQQQPQYGQPAPAPTPQYQPAPAQQPPPQYQPAPAQQPPPQYQPAPGQPQPQPGTPPGGYQPQPQPQPEPGQPQGYPPAQAPYPNAPPYPGADQVGPPPQQGPIPDGAFQLGLSVPIVRYRPLGIEVDNNGPEVDFAELTWGIAQNPINLELGYGLTDSIVLGAILGLGGTSESQEQQGAADADSSEFAFEFGPKFDYMFSPGAKVNPFVGAQVLLNLESFDEGVEGSRMMFLFLARIGMRAFLADGFSIDPALMVGGGFGSGSQDVPGGEVDYSASSFQIGLNIGFSGWLR